MGSDSATARIHGFPLVVEGKRQLCGARVAAPRSPSIVGGSKTRDPRPRRERQRIAKSLGALAYVDIDPARLSMLGLGNAQA
jgi:hypothetical protein